jgi:hypothetical protein
MKTDPNYRRQDFAYAVLPQWGTQHVKALAPEKSLADLKAPLKHAIGFRKQFLQAVDEIRSRADDPIQKSA